jgi:hypothetical protein
MLSSSSRITVYHSVIKYNYNSNHSNIYNGTRSRGRPRRTVESPDAESRPRGRPRAEPVAYISQLSCLRPLDLGRMNKGYPHCHTLHWIDERQETPSLRNPSWGPCCKQGSANYSSCLTRLSVWRAYWNVQTLKEGTLRTTFASTTLLLPLFRWDATLSQLRSVMPTVTEVDLTHFRSTAPFVTVKGLYFQLRSTHLRMLSYTSMILHMLLRDYQKGMKIWTMRL